MMLSDGFGGCWPLFYSIQLKKWIVFWSIPRNRNEVLNIVQKYENLVILFHYFNLNINDIMYDKFKCLLFS